MGVRRVPSSPTSSAPSPALQRSRTRGSAERRRDGQRVQRKRIGFNGAALVGVRRDDRRPGDGGAGEPASTEPHSWECGETRSFHLEATTPGRLLQRSRTRGSAESWLESRECGMPTPGFNGAALVGVRRGRSAWHPWPTSGSLQRSRTRGSAESPRTATK